MSADTRTTSFDAGARAKRGFWSGLFASDDPQWGPPPEQSCRLAPHDPLQLLAEGDVLAFQVYLNVQWRGPADSYDDLLVTARTLVPKVRHLVTEWFRPVARTYEPRKAIDLEKELNRRLGDTWRTLTEDGQELRYLVRLRVEPDEIVREQMRPYWAARIKAECDHALELQRAEQAETLTKHWSTVFEQLAKNPRAAYAARLSEQEFAEVFKTYVDGRERAVHDLVGLLRSAVNDHRDVKLGPSEYTRAWDDAIKAFEQMYGLKPGGE
jgi:hypothetical protein